MVLLFFERAIFISLLWSFLICNNKIFSCNEKESNTAGLGVKDTIVLGSITLAVLCQLTALWSKPVHERCLVPPLAREQ